MVTKEEQSTVCINAIQELIDKKTGRTSAPGCGVACNTVQAPQSPSAQTTFVPVIPLLRLKKSESGKRVSGPRTSTRSPLI